MQKRIEGMAHGVDIVGPPLDRFYNALSDEQKARLNAANEQERRNRGSLASCGAVSNATRWPGEQIEKAVRPDPGQQQSSMRSRRQWTKPPVTWRMPVRPPCRRPRRPA
jgi:hypothetical protein